MKQNKLNIYTENGQQSHYSKNMGIVYKQTIKGDSIKFSFEDTDGNQIELELNDQVVNELKRVLG